MLCVAVDTVRVLVGCLVRVEGLGAVRKVAALTPPPRPSCLWSVWCVGLVQVVASEVALVLMTPAAL